MTSRRFAGLLTGMMGGLLIWAAHLATVYAFAALACSRGFADATLLGLPVVHAGIAAATVAALAGTAVVVVRARRGPWPAAGAEAEAAGFVRWLAVAFAGLALVAIAWIALPAWLVPVCG